MPHISATDLTTDYGKFILEPLEKGYGQTIGNALRRVLLSSIQGAAVSAVGGLATCGCMARRTSHTPAPTSTISTIAAAIQLPVDDCLRMSFPVVVC